MIWPRREALGAFMDTLVEALREWTRARVASLAGAALELQP
jgi:hypothetical protein